MAFGPIVDAFLDHLRVERGSSRHTLDAYGRDLADFTAYAESQGAHDPNELKLEVVSGWLGELARRGLSPRSAARKLSSVRSLFRHLLVEGALLLDPTELVVRPRFGRPLPRPLSVEDVVRLIHAPDASSPRGRRDRAMLSLAYAAGLRVSELVTLSLGDVDFQRGVAQAFGKGNKRRLVPLGEVALAHLNEYLSARRERPEVPRSSLLFPSRGGRPLTRAAFWKIVARHARRAGLTGPVHPHRLRHSFATHLLSGGADLRSVQTLLGHENVATTEIYTLVTKDALRSVHAKTHPRG